MKNSQTTHIYEMREGNERLTTREATTVRFDVGIPLELSV